MLWNCFQEPLPWVTSEVVKNVIAASQQDSALAWKMVSLVVRGLVSLIPFLGIVSPYTGLTLWHREGVDLAWRYGRRERSGSKQNMKAC